MSQRLRRPPVSPTLALSILAVLTALSGGAYAAVSASHAAISACVSRHHGALYIARHCARHDRRLTWSVTGPVGARGAAGAPGQPGQPGSPGSPGPGAAEFTYDAPAGPASSTPIGTAGPFTLSGTCLFGGGLIDHLSLNATTSSNVIFDQGGQAVTDGGPPGAVQGTINFGVHPQPLMLLQLSNSTMVNDSSSFTTLVLTTPVHGTLTVFQHVSLKQNDCHMSIVWTPAS
jgi:hypothetical protein